MKDYTTIGDSFQNVTIFDYNSLMSRKMDATSGTHTRKDRREVPNYNLFANSFTLNHKCEVHPSEPVMKKAFEKLREISLKLNPVANTKRGGPSQL